MIIDNVQKFYFKALDAVERQVRERRKQQRNY